VLSVICGFDAVTIPYVLPCFGLPFI
jgi:hypothetical protein